MMQEYDDDFFFEEDKIASKPTESNDIHKNLLLAINDDAPITEQDPEASITNTENNDPFEDTMIVAEEQTDCVFNDMRRDRYMIRHQNLM